MSFTLHGVTDTLPKGYEKYSKALEQVGRTLQEVEAIFQEPGYDQREGWKKDESNKEGDTVYARETPQGKMVTISSELPGSPQFVMKMAWDHIPELPNWNDNISDATVIDKPTEHFDIVRYATNNILIVSGRDFVTARIYRKIGDTYIMAAKSVDLSEEDAPEQEGKERGDIILAGGRFRPHPEKKGKTISDVVTIPDLKGMLPKFMVDQVIGKIVLKEQVTNRNHLVDVVEGRE